MRSIPGSLFVIAALLPSLALAQQPDAAESAKWYRADTSPWVEPVDIRRLLPEPGTELDLERRFLIVDQQTDARHGNLERYYHFAWTFVDEATVQDGSQLELEFDPAYEELALHELVLWRDGQRLDQMDSVRIEMLQREGSLDYQLYDGSHTLLLMLEGVRKGDVLEYAFSLRGFNPVFDGHFMDSLPLRWGAPVAIYRYRVLWPMGQELVVHGHGPGTERQPSITLREEGDYREYFWEEHDVPAVLQDGNTPTWYDDYPWVQLSSFLNWKDVARWGARLYDVPETLPAELEEELDAIRADQHTPEGRALAALRFVQDEIRYLGIEMGPGSHRPSPPDEVLRRRFGDCKDKSLLLVCMLRALDIPAVPVLVSTRYRGHVDDWHASPWAFDHVIVRARLERDYWLDATALYERGPIGEAGVNGFGRALVIEEGTTRLASIESAEPQQPSLHVRVEFEVGATDAAVPMTVRTVYTRAEANGYRHTYRGTSRPELAKSYLNYYAELYPSIESAGDLGIVDEEDANRIEVIERYSVPDFWVWSDDYEGHLGELYPLELGGYVGSPPTRNRTTPLGLVHPVHFLYEISVSFADGWGIDAEAELVDVPGLRFDYRATVDGEELLLSYEYRSLSDHVAADDCREYLDGLERVEELLGMSITAPGEDVDGALWLLVTGGLALVAAIALAIGLFFWNPGRKPPEVVAEPSGIGGWLVLVAIGVVLTPLGLVRTFVNELVLFDPATWTGLTVDAQGETLVGAVLLLLVEFGGVIVLGVLSPLQIVVFFMRRRLFPSLFIGMRVFNLSIGFCGLVAVGAFDPFSIGLMMGSSVMGLIWIAYMLRSRRVRNTFVR